VFTIPDLSFHHFRDFHAAGNRDTWLAFTHDVILPHADVILTYSEHTRQDVAQTFGFPAERIHAVPLAHGERFRPLPDRQALAAGLARFGLDGQRYVLTVGTLEPRKNHALLLRAFARMVRADPALPHQLVLAGARGWHDQSIFDLVGELGLRERVVFPGHSDPLEVLYNGADVFVYPSFFEGFGLPPLEAMACGTPVITSNSSSLPEIVGDAGLQIDPHDEAGLCEALGGLLHDPARRGRLAEAGLEWASQFSWEKTAAETLCAYEAARKRRP
jgi:glycosyltransferase involved in cell wall biosynthesis